MTMQEYVEIKGKKVKVPEFVQNIEAFIEWKTAELEFKANPRRKYTFKNGKTIIIPCPNLKGFFDKNPDCKKEKSAVEKQAKEMRSIQGSVNMLKRKCASKDGASYGKSIKETLFEVHGAQMLEWFGDFKSPYEVHRLLVKKGVEGLTYNSVNRFFHDNTTKIRELRVKIREDYDDLSIGIKRSRLEKLDYLLQSLYEDFEKAAGSSKVQLSREIRGIIDQARKEVEGDELKLTVNGRIDIQATIEAEVRRTNLLQNLTINQIVLSRICNRSDNTLSYNQMVNRLAYSFYSKFNGFRAVETLEEKPIYPSSITYDILELEGAYQKQKSIEKERDEKEQNQNNAIEVPDLRNNLLNFIDKIKRDNEQRSK